MLYTPASHGEYDHNTTSLNYQNMKHFFITLCAVFFFLGSQAQSSIKSTDVLLKEARQQAAKENKKVFVIFHASWCHWCHKLDTAMADASCKPLFDKSYVTCHLTVLENGDKKSLENPGAMELLKAHHGDQQGIPFWLIFDKDGKLVADSQIRPEGASLDTQGQNIGYPGSKDEIAAFQKVLRKTSKLSEAEITLIGERFAALKGS